jgi:hypothetical protein
MAGPMTHVDYTADDLSTCRLKTPQWNATLQGAGAATAVVNCPKGLRPRRRFYRITATGREGSFVVFDPANAHYTDDFGTAVTVENGVYGGTGVAATLEGRTGERSKAI